MWDETNIILKKRKINLKKFIKRKREKFFFYIAFNNNTQSSIKKCKNYEFIVNNKWMNEKQNMKDKLLQVDRVWIIQLYRW